MFPFTLRDASYTKVMVCVGTWEDVVLVEAVGSVAVVSVVGIVNLIVDDFIGLVVTGVDVLDTNVLTIVEVWRSVVLLA